MSIVYLDTETTGLDSAIHEVWEIAFATGGGPIRSGIVPHVGISADPKALELNGYYERDGKSFMMPEAAYLENGLYLALHGQTLCAANPAFDVGFLRDRWGRAPWKYRLFDIEAYAMGAFGWDIPRGLKDVAAALRDQGWDIPEPDHTASGDVATLRACHLALVDVYDSLRKQAGL